MDRYLDPAFYDAELDATRHWLEENALSLSVATLGQALAIGILYLVARLLSGRIRARLLRTGAAGAARPEASRLALVATPLVLPAVWLLLLWPSVVLAAGAGLPLHLLKTAASLLSAWVVIRLTASLVRDPLWSRLVAVVIWVIAALSILDLLEPTMVAFDRVALSLGGLRISVLTVIEGLLSLALLLWVATLVGRVLERRITSAATLTPSLQVLVVKLLKIVLAVIAVFLALRTVGIDLTAFAVLTGAIGVGIGFGLQKIVANFVSGITILLDKSIKPGDVLVVGDTYGRVNALAARYVSVITRDGMEYLIPNEELVTRQVVNWTYSSRQVRLRQPVGISYRSDVRRAMALCLESAGAVGRVMKEPAPVCLLKGFGDSSVDLELRFWIQDPMNGLSNVRSEVLLNIWDRFQADGIEIPFPQRDLHVRTPLEVTVRDAALAPGG
ncbi:mechanosensitive ion channel family protein [Reyranella sp.]|uniref:mechanosensitive ion channel family protein n=1 Tax=Reyranella sp. TaxID=1929291 RepID=UPI003BA892ED